MVKSLDTEAELTATGMPEKKGVLLVEVPADSELATYGFKSGDVVLFIDKAFTAGLT